MSTSVTISLDEATLQRARIAASERGMTVQAFLADLIKRLHPLVPEPQKSDVSSIIDMVSEGEPTDIAKEKDKLVGEAVWQEYQRETRQK
jgi:hypothetical protein